MTAALAQPTFWILTSLAGGRRHGYEIMRETEAASEGRVSLKVTTLYANLDRLERAGLICADGEDIVNGRARRYYRIASEGSAQLAAEVELLEKSTRLARSRLAARPAVPVAPRIAVAPHIAVAPRIAVA